MAGDLDNFAEMPATRIGRVPETAKKSEGL